MQLKMIPSPCTQALAHGCMFDIVIPLLAMQEMGLVEQTLGNEEIAAEWFKQAAISDKQKSRMKRRMFESRKAASKWKKPNSNKSALTTASAVPQYQGSPKPQFHEQFPERKESTKRPF
jgi:hypothetical protein